LSTLEFIRAVRDIRTRIASLEHFQAKQVNPVKNEVNTEIEIMRRNWRELVLRELIRKAEDIDADAIIRVDYQNDGVIRIEETGVKLKRLVATGIAVKLSRAA
jgi:uncharacterized protein YbjQ (UPF0145 family)